MLEKMKKPGFLLFSLFFIILLFLLWASRTGFTLERPVRVQTAIATRGPVPDTYSCFGIVASRETTILKSPVSGKLGLSKIKEGEPFFPGQELARIIRPEWEERRRALEAEKTTARDEAVSAGENSERLLVAYQEGRLTLSQLNEVRHHENLARERFLRVAGALRQVNAKISEGSLVASSSGIVLRRFLTSGEEVRARDSIMSLAGKGFVAQLVLPVATPLAVGQKVEVSPLASNEMFFGEIGGLFPSSLSVSEGWVALNENSHWEEGTLVKLGVQIGFHQGLSVPPQAVFLIGAQPIVYTVDGNTARQVAIKMGRRSPREI
ncbi:MAG TPA: efflux RND transporter periplasmic adaptor subunit, partial [Chroococcales cyanobacterium]